MEKLNVTTEQLNDFFKFIEVTNIEIKNTEDMQNALEFYKDSMIKLYRRLYNLNGTMTKDGNLLIDNMFSNFLIEKEIN
jgi:translation initiation factor 2 beta subunit (eIF-2beta)/eIF-5